MADVSRIVFMVSSSRKGLLQNLHERRRGDRLPQEVDCSCRSRPTLLVVAGPTADEDDRNVEVACGELTLDLEPVHVRHTNVEHEAGGPGGHWRGQELLPRSELLGPIAERPDQTAGRPPHRRIVIHYGDERRRGPRLAPSLATRAGSRHGRNVAAHYRMVELSLGTGVVPVLRDRALSGPGRGRAVQLSGPAP